MYKDNIEDYEKQKVPWQIKIAVQEEMRNIYLYITRCNLLHRTRDFAERLELDDWALCFILNCLYWARFSDGLWNEAVTEPGCSLQTAVPPTEARWDNSLWC